MSKDTSDIAPYSQFQASLATHAVSLPLPEKKVSGAFVELSGPIEFEHLLSFFDDWRQNSSQAISRFGATQERVSRGGNLSSNLTGAAAQVVYKMLDYLVDTPEKETWSLRLITHSNDLCVTRLTKEQMERYSSHRPFRLCLLEGAAPFFKSWIRNYFAWDENKAWLAIISQRNFETREEWDNYARAVGEPDGPNLEAKNLVLTFAGLVLPPTVEPSAEQMEKVAEAIKKGTQRVTGK